MRTTTRLALFATASLMSLAQAQAQDDLETRVEALEGKLDRILERLDAQEDVLTAEEADDIREAAAIVRAMPDEIRAPQTFGERPPTEILADRPKGFMAGDTEVLLGGYLKLDAAVAEYSGGTPPTNSLGRDFYIPALVPVGEPAEDPDPVLDFNPRETRLFFAFNNDDVAGHKVGGKIELDFQVTNTPFENERVSNSFVPRMRQAFITVDNWLLGQTWSTFQDVSALPDNLEFIGPTEGTVFNRQPMVRYSRGDFQFALEQPETLITTSTGGRVNPGLDTLPDAVVRWNPTGDWGHFSLAGIARQLRADGDVLGLEDAATALGWGVSAAGKLKVGERDDFRFMATYGDGVGRYIGVNIVNDAAVDEDGDLETFETLSGFASYRHFWTPKLRSNLTGGYFTADNPVELVGGGVTEQVWSAHANLIYSLSPVVDLGVEYLYADREVESGADGQLNKLLFSAKYGF